LLQFTAKGWENLAKFAARADFAAGAFFPNTLTAYVGRVRDFIQNLPVKLAGIPDECKHVFMEDPHGGCHDDGVRK
jgi:hypothetical protein